MPSSFSRPVACRPRPRRSTAFSLKIATGLRHAPLVDDEAHGVRSKIDHGAARHVGRRLEWHGSVLVHAIRAAMIGERRGNAGPCNAEPRPESDGLVMK